MNKIEFENKYKDLIIQASLEDLLNLLNKQQTSNSLPRLWVFLHKIKDRFSKKKYASFLELGYSKQESFDFVNMLYDTAIEHHRADMIKYLLKNNYVTNFNKYFYLRKLFDSEKVFNSVLSDSEISNNITTNEYAEMLRYCSVKNLPEKFDTICSVAKEKLKLIDKQHLDQIIIYAAQNDSKQMLLKLLHMKEPLVFDINAKNDDEFAHIYSRENVLIASARNNNLQMVKYLLVSSELEKNSDLSESFNYLQELPNGKEIIDYIIFDIQAPLTENLENLLKEKDYKDYLDMFQKRDLMLKINKKLPFKNEKTKVKKI